MCRRLATLCLIAVLAIAVFSGCVEKSPLESALAEYGKVVEGKLPEDIRLTIYYIDPNIYTRVPLSKDALITFPGVKMITVQSGELASEWELLKELKPSILQPIQEGSYINARLCYIFEVGNSNEILEVIISQIHGNVFVNGIEVEDHPVFYKLIGSFLTDQDRETLGI